MALIALFIGGLVLLVAGAELTVRGAARLAASLGVKPLLLGLTVVSVGTSMPELAVGLVASGQGRGALAVGNIAGTNTLNILFILGLSAVMRPLPLHRQIFKLDLPMMLAAAVLMEGLAWDGVLSRVDGAVMLLMAVVYTAALFFVSRKESSGAKSEAAAELEDKLTAGKRSEPPPRRAADAFLLAAGVALLVLGADWLVAGAVGIARALAISEALIGLTIVAIGTSAPELVTTIIGTLRNERDVAVGNLLGSSIYNIGAILGATCLVSPEGLPVERHLLYFDIPIMVGVAIVCVPVFLSGRGISRLEGGLFVGSYLAYLLALLFFRS